MDDLQAVSIISDIFNGHSLVLFEDKPAYVKHFKLQDQKQTEIWKDSFLLTARKRGLPSEKETIKRLERDGLWTKNDDSALSDMKAQCNNLRLTLKQLVLAKDREQVEQDLIIANNALAQKQALRKELIGSTADDFASMQANLKFVHNSFFVDPELSKRLFDDDEFDELDHNQLHELNMIYKKVSDNFSDLMIQKAVLSDWFNLYISQTENFHNFYGKAVKDLSVFQLKLTAYGRLFNNIFQYHDDIPDFYRKDPEAILRHVELKDIQSKGRNHKAFAPTRKAENSASAVFGASKEELKAIDPDAKTVSLSDAIEKAGGSMSMNDIIKMMHE